MNIRLGFYDIFSRVVPGCIYLAAFVQLAIITGMTSLDWQSLNQISLMSSIGLVVVAYILGATFAGAASVWRKLFKVSESNFHTLNEFKQVHQKDWTFNFDEKDWTILRAYIRTKDLELASDIDKHNALSIMLLNVSFGLILMMINQIIAYIIDQKLLYIFTGFIMLLTSIFVAVESAKLRKWFFNAIFETIIAYRLELEEYVKPVKSKKVKK